ncbi:MAG: DUF4845 domain-containing protein [Lysobacterales bacterium]
MSIIIILAVLGFFAYIGIRLFPMYTEYYGVLQAMKTVQAAPGVGQMQPDRILSLLDNNFAVGYVSSVKRQNITLTRAGGGYLLRVAYEVRSPLVGNLDVVAKFDKTVDLVRRGPD